MKKIINNKLYNTESAKLVGEFQSTFAVNDFHYYEEELYLKKTGEFFLYGHGNGLSPYAKRYIDGMGQGEKIIPLTDQQARKWAEENMDPDDYMELFEVDEDSSARFHFKLPAGLKAEFEKACEAEGTSMGRKLNEMIENYLNK